MVASDDIDLILVTAGTGSDGAYARIHNWVMTSAKEPLVVVNIHQGPRKPSLGQEAFFNTVQVSMKEHLGTVPAFALGLGVATKFATPGRLTLACAFHDDLDIKEESWDLIVRHAHAGQDNVLSGFFGGKGLGRDDIYSSPYDPYQLARQDCYSNMVDAEAHGMRSTKIETVAVLDGFSQIAEVHWLSRAFSKMAAAGIKHHAYDAYLGILAAANGVTVKMLPVSCRHLGGQTAVLDQRYQEWAAGKAPGGDAGLWLEAHRITYEAGRGVLPVRVR